MTDTEIDGVSSQPVLRSNTDQWNDMTLEQMIVALNAYHLKKLEKNITDELNPLKDRQDQVAIFHKIIKSINSSIDANGELSGEKLDQILEDMRAELTLKRDEKLAELNQDPEKNKAEIERIEKKYEEIFAIVDDVKKMGSDIRKDAKNFTPEMRLRLVDSIKMDLDDLNVQNDMQLQKVSRLNNERYESYQLARSMLKTLHDIIMSHVRGMAGR